MGEAKRRGTKEQRAQAAHAATEALRPEFVECGKCHAHVTQLESMDVRGELGLAAVFAGTCPNCSHHVWTFAGDPTAVQRAVLVMQQLAESEHGLPPGMELETFVGTAERKR